ncbi:hypothetical protein [Microbacterium sp. XT11]|uniref:hypothetical protein n=1 Tax=Microbacterium sp. XT11 TaxID=367477 RepID=UPI000B15ED54|nr:hypothetical protein [Microbacterium sp. XT11]
MTKDGPTLSWTQCGDARFFAVYSGTGTPEEVVQTPGTLIDRVWAGDDGTFSYEIPADADPDAVWVVTALDAASVESQAVAAAAPAQHPGNGKGNATGHDKGNGNGQGHGNGTPCKAPRG